MRCLCLTNYEISTIEVSQEEKEAATGLISPEREAWSPGLHFFTRKAVGILHVQIRQVFLDPQSYHKYRGRVKAEDSFGFAPLNLDKWS